MTRQRLPFSKAHQLEVLIARYFSDCSGEKTIAEIPSAKAKGPAKNSHTASRPTISGLTLRLGFDSRQSFEAYETKGKFGRQLKRARLRIEEFYEERLHTQYTSGAIFALKNLGWSDRHDGKHSGEPANVTVKVDVVQTGPQLAGTENDVIL
jgi:hypothetical protein